MFAHLRALHPRRISAHLSSQFPMDCSLPGSSIHGVFQARVLEWVAIAFSMLACEMGAIVWYFEHSLALLFFGIGMKIDLFQSYGHCIGEGNGNPLQYSCLENPMDRGDW